MNGALSANTDASFVKDASGFGDCRVATSVGSLPESSVTVIVEHGAFVQQAEAVAVPAITAPLGGGTIDFGVERRETPFAEPSGIQFHDVQVSAVALSPN